MFVVAAAVREFGDAPLGRLVDAPRQQSRPSETRGVSLASLGKPRPRGGGHEAAWKPARHPRACLRSPPRRLRL